MSLRQVQLMIEVKPGVNNPINYLRAKLESKFNGSESKFSDL